MGDYALWPTRENYQRWREIMDDGEKFPVTFDQWEVNAKRTMASAKKAGITIKPVPFDAEKFITFCDEKKIPRDSKSRGLFAVTVGVASDMH
jgi:hypothetical protein